MNTNIQCYKIYGERNSGTNFLETAISTNFDIPYIRGHGNKHFWSDYHDYGLLNNKSCLVIVIVRNVCSWINSMYRQPFHLQPQLNNYLGRELIITPTTKKKFLNKEFWSYYDNPDGVFGSGPRAGESMYGIEIGMDKNQPGDRHLITGKRYKNIFEQRAVKLEYAVNEIPKKVKNYHLIKLEDLKNNYNTVLSNLTKKFDLTPLHKSYTSVTKYRGTGEDITKKSKPPLVFTDDEILSHPDLCMEVENGAGYQY